MEITQGLKIEVDLKTELPASFWKTPIKKRLNHDDLRLPYFAHFLVKAEH